MLLLLSLSLSRTRLWVCQFNKIIIRIVSGIVLIKLNSLIVCVSKLKLVTVVKGDPKAPFSIATPPGCWGRHYSFSGLLYFTLDPYLIMLSVKQGSIKYPFLSLWYDSTWDWIQVSRAIGEHSNHYANVRLSVCVLWVKNLITCTSAER